MDIKTDSLLQPDPKKKYETVTHFENRTAQYVYQELKYRVKHCMFLANSEFNSPFNEGRLSGINEAIEILLRNFDHHLIMKEIGK